MRNDYEIRGDVTAIFIKRRNGQIVETIIDTYDLGRVQELGSINAGWDKKLQVFNVGSTLRLENGKFMNIKLSRYLMGFPNGLMVDHINNNTLDNRRSCNLREATRVLNGQNRVGANRSSKSGIRGVYWHKSSRKWTAKVVVKQRRINLGLFETIEDAEKAVKQARAETMPFSKEAMLMNSK